MQILTVVALILGAIALLLTGLLRVLTDLLERGPFDAPSIDDGLAWPQLTQTSAAEPRPTRESAARGAADPSLTR